MTSAGYRESVQSLISWLVERSLAGASVAEIAEGVGARVWATDLPLWRFTLAVPRLHPLTVGTLMNWERGQPLNVEERTHAAADDEYWTKSTFFQLVKHDLRQLRRRLSEDERLDGFPLLPRLRDRGATDYLAFRVPVPALYRVTQTTEDPVAPDAIVGSWVTDAPGGWSADAIVALQEIEPVLAMAVNAAAARETTDSILKAYLGEDAARRVTRGTIERGDVTSIDAVIWFSDLRDSTPLAERSTPAEYLSLLNDYFECTAGSVVERGGEILRFIGDASLGIFPTDGDGGVRGACERALAAARDAARKASVRNAAREGSGPLLGYGIGLHRGELLFGNIGIPTRIEFSVIGAAANAAARIEALTKTLGEQTVVSAEFAEHVDVAWRPLGRHALRGVGSEVEVFAPPVAPDS
jgi:adenylate cyclase